jgi:hypothetical protein
MFSLAVSTSVNLGLALNTTLFLAPIVLMVFNLILQTAENLKEHDLKLLKASISVSPTCDNESVSPILPRKDN